MVAVSASTSEPTSLRLMAGVRGGGGLLEGARNEERGQGISQGLKWPPRAPCFSEFLWSELTRREYASGQGPAASDGKGKAAAGELTRLGARKTRDTSYLRCYIRGGTRRGLRACVRACVVNQKKISLHWPRLASSTLQLTSSRDLLETTGLVLRSNAIASAKEADWSVWWMPRQG